MVEINEALTRKVAELARLELSNAEVKTFTAQLSDILAYVDQLSEANVQGVEPLTSPLALESPLRPDRVRPSPVDEKTGKSKMLKAAPEVVYDGFKVPPVL
jgi:aspartyl-tRNA(Asn)/glutamyl-tRNA(Gln) amidotransferase subunit C